MKNRTIKILLFVSLAFNIAFLGGGVFRFMQMRKFHSIHKRIKNEKARNFMQQRKEMGGPLLREFHQAKDDFMKALAQENINEEMLLVKVDSLIAKQIAMEREISKSMIELRRQLSPEEAKDVFGKLRKWMQSPEHFERKDKHPEPHRRFKRD
ncbi:MAG: hypothetical protein DRH79_04045 [Candidatus Cloacimonadota bacterium]|nr:MAG: hypothetical protein DRH79_04045 [Candidatus Cloacimonadota bacterium]